jgi:Xaa-Pro aminopeptidase
MLVYGDEYRKEFLRYVSNYWPIFERGALIIAPKIEPILLCAPECEEVAREMSAWKDIRNVKNFACVTVPDDIDYSQANITSFSNLYKEISKVTNVKKLGIVGLDAMSINVFDAIKEGFNNMEIVDCNHILNRLRLIKSKNEIECLKESWRIADIGYKALMEACVPGNTELDATGAAEKAAREAGAEHIVFTVFGSGERSNTIVGRPTSKVMRNGDMIMAALAIQYEGYVSTVEFPFVCGNASSKQKELIEALVVADKKALKKLRNGVKMNEFVKEVKDHFKAKGLTKYDIYPPLHGCGCAEAESPYPNESTEAIFETGMTVNTDISLFGTPMGSNRIEEGFVVTEEGYESMSGLIRGLVEKYK